MLTSFLNQSCGFEINDRWTYSKIRNIVDAKVNGDWCRILPFRCFLIIILQVIGDWCRNDPFPFQFMRKRMTVERKNIISKDRYDIGIGVAIVPSRTLQLMRKPIRGRKNAGVRPWYDWQMGLDSSLFLPGCKPVGWQKGSRRILFTAYLLFLKLDFLLTLSRFHGIFSSCLFANCDCHRSSTSTSHSFSTKEGVWWALLADLLLY